MSKRVITIRSGRNEVRMEVTEKEYQNYYRPWWQQKKREQRNREAMEEQGYIEKVRNAYLSAKDNPAEENIFRQLRLNQWVKQSTRWMQMMDNIFIRTDPAGNIKPDKEKSTEKIDGAVATIMALDRAIRHGCSSGSVYDERGILSF